MLNEKTSFLNCFMGNARGGIEVVMRDYADSLKSAGYKSELLSVRGKNYTQYILESKLKTYLMFSRGLNPFSVLQFAYYLYKSKPDIVFLHGTKAIEFGACKFIKALFPNIKFIGVSHGVSSSKYKGLSYAIGVNPHLKHKLSELGIAKTYHCPNVTKVIEPKKKKNTVVTIGTSGRTSRAKGFDVLLEALGILASQKIPFRCLFAGSETKDYQLFIDKYKLEKHVRFLGWINDKEEFYNSLDIYCSASRIEPFGLTLIEAMMHNLPLVATKCEGPCTIVKPTFGILVEKEDPHQLANALKVLIKSPQKREKMGKMGRIEALNEYNKDNLTKHLLEICSDIAKDS